MFLRSDDSKHKKTHVNCEGQWRIHYVSGRRCGDRHAVDRDQLDVADWGFLFVLIACMCQK